MSLVYLLVLKYREVGEKVKKEENKNSYGRVSWEVRDNGRFYEMFFVALVKKNMGERSATTEPHRSC